jgi:hypothetical protein
MIFQYFTERYEVRIGVADVVEKVGQNTKTNFLFDIRNAVAGFDYDHLRWKVRIQLGKSQYDQFVYVGIGDAVLLGWVLDDEHGFFLYFGQKKARSV